MAKIWAVQADWKDGRGWITLDAISLWKNKARSLRDDYAMAYTDKGMVPPKLRVKPIAEAPER